jgi:hypothetical protein
LDIKLEFFLGENDGFVISGRTAVEQITKSAAAALFAFGGTITGATKGGLRVSALNTRAEHDHFVST